MIKRFLILTLLLTTIFALYYFVSPRVNTFVTKQVALVIGIDINHVLAWSSQKGLNQNLKIGDSGKDVRLLQYALNKTTSGFSSRSIDGHFGKKTSIALSNFQKSKGLKVTGKLDSKTRVVLNDLYFKELCPDGQGNIYPDEMMIHLNKKIALPSDYIPDDLISVSDSIKTISIVCVKQDVAPFLKQMFDDAQTQGVALAATSGFRRPEVQSFILKTWLYIRGEKARDRVAEPLHSEHQLGTTVDLTGKSVGYISADDKFIGATEELWLRKNAYKYGFVLSYPKDKVSITGYDYEPWHYRFMGIDIAKQIFDEKISVEEYFASN